MKGKKSFSGKKQTESHQTNANGTQFFLLAEPFPRSSEAFERRFLLNKIGMFFFLLKGRSGQLKKLGFSHLYIEFPEKNYRGLRVQELSKDFC